MVNGKSPRKSLIKSPIKSPRIKKINLDSVAPGKDIANLTEAEREAVRNLLKLTFGGND